MSCRFSVFGRTVFIVIKWNMALTFTPNNAISKLAFSFQRLCHVWLIARSLVLMLRVGVQFFFQPSMLVFLCIIFKSSLIIFRHFTSIAWLLEADENLVIFCVILESFLITFRRFTSMAWLLETAENLEKLFWQKVYRCGTCH